VDKSFEGLLFSILLHFALALFFIYAKFPPPNDNHATEVTLIERPEPKPTPKGHLIVPQVNQQQPDKNVDIKKQADFLSQFTKRVKQELHAKMGDEMRNAAAKNAQVEREQRKRVAGQEKKDPGDLNQQTEQREQEMAAVQTQTSVQDIIPGIENANMTALNTDQFTYYTFYNRAGTQVRNRWVPGLRTYVQLLTAKMQEELSTRNRTTVLEVLLTPEGQWFRSIVQRSCGDKGLDEVAVQAFHEAAPFPHPPGGMVRSDGFIHFYAEFTVYFRPPTFGPAG
jgi:TonB family protein